MCNAGPTHPISNDYSLLQWNCSCKYESGVSQQDKSAVPALDTSVAHVVVDLTLNVCRLWLKKRNTITIPQLISEELDFDIKAHLVCGISLCGHGCKP